MPYKDREAWMLHPFSRNSFLWCQKCIYSGVQAYRKVITGQLYYPIWWLERSHPVPKEYNGKLNFATDSWSSPNHKSYVAITVHFKDTGKPFLMLLDLVEVTESHTGMNMGIAFVAVLKNFGIEGKVRTLNGDQRMSLTCNMHCRYLA